MKAKIIFSKTKSGYLYGRLHLSKGLNGELVLQQCLRHKGMICGNWCPAFAWTKHENGSVTLHLCSECGDYLFEKGEFATEKGLNDESQRPD